MAQDWKWDSDDDWDGIFDSLDSIEIATDSDAPGKRALPSSDEGSEQNPFQRLKSSYEDKECLGASSEASDTGIGTDDSSSRGEIGHKSASILTSSYFRSDDGVASTTSSSRASSSHEMCPEDKAKLKELLNVPLRLIGAKNSANSSLLSKIIQKYFTADCHIKFPLFEGVGGHHLLSLFRAINSSCPDDLAVLKHVKYHKRCIRAKFFFSSTKIFTNKTDSLFDFSQRNDIHPELYAKAQDILSRGKRYKLSGTGRILLVPAACLTKFCSSHTDISDLDVTEAPDIEEDDDSEEN